MTGNGLFDPDVTGVGAQPLGFDQWAGLYQRYRGLASAIEVNINTPGASTNPQAAVKVALVPSNVATSFTDFDAASSFPYAKTRFLNGISGGAGPFAPLRSVMETSIMTGQSKQAVLGDDNLAALTSANPADLWYWHVYAQPIDIAASVTYQVVVKVHYLVDFFDRYLLTQSLSRDAPALSSTPQDDEELIVVARRFAGKGDPRSGSRDATGSAKDAPGRSRVGQ